jgi:hypothetical protein
MDLLPRSSTASRARASEHLRHLGLEIVVTNRPVSLADPALARILAQNKLTPELLTPLRFGTHLRIRAYPDNPILR